MHREITPVSRLLQACRREQAAHAYQNRYIAQAPDGRPCNPCNERVALSFHGAVIRGCYPWPTGTDQRVFTFLGEQGLIPSRKPTKSDCLGAFDRAIAVALRLEHEENNRLAVRRAA